MSTVSIFDMDLRVIKDLGNGFVLAAHKNGPVICNCNETALATLCFCGYEPRIKFTEPTDADDAEESYTLEDAQRARYGARLEEVEFNDEGFPFKVRSDAIRSYVEWSWKHVKDHVDAT